MTRLKAKILDREIEVEGEDKFVSDVFAEWCGEVKALLERRRLRAEYIMRKESQREAEISKVKIVLAKFQKELDFLRSSAY